MHSLSAVCSVNSSCKMKRACLFQRNRSLWSFALRLLCSSTQLSIVYCKWREPTTIHWLSTPLHLQVRRPLCATYLHKMHTGIDQCVNDMYVLQHIYVLMYYIHICLLYIRMYIRTYVHNTHVALLECGAIASCLCLLRWHWRIPCVGWCSPRPAAQSGHCCSLCHCGLLHLLRKEEVRMRTQTECGACMRHVDRMWCTIVHVRNTLHA